MDELDDVIGELADTLVVASFDLGAAFVGE